MDTYWIRVVSQTGTYLTFLIYLIWTIRHGAQAWVPLIGTILYALVFEHFNMLRYANVIGGYYYNPRSWWFVLGDVPLYIPLAWAFIVSTSQALTDQLELSAWSKPYCDALLALLIDLSLDIVAIRLNFWYWRGIAYNDAFFGVPADNFLGWLLVTFTFSLLTRRLWRNSGGDAKRLPARILTQWLVIPVVAYLLYLGIEWFVHLAYSLFHAVSLRGQLGVLGGVIALFLAAVVAGSRDREQGRSEPHTEPGALPQAGVAVGHATPGWRFLALHGPRHIFHLFGLIGLLCVPVAARSPALWLITLTVWAVEWSIAFRVHRCNPGR